MRSASTGTPATVISRRSARAKAGVERSQESAQRNLRDSGRETRLPPWPSVARDHRGRCSRARAPHQLRSAARLGAACRDGSAGARLRGAVRGRPRLWMCDFGMYAMDSCGSKRATSPGSRTSRSTTTPSRPARPASPPRQGISSAPALIETPQPGIGAALRAATGRAEDADVALARSSSNRGSPSGVWLGGWGPSDRPQASACAYVRSDHRGAGTRLEVAILGRNGPRRGRNRTAL